MSLRQPVSRDRIEDFLRWLGNHYRRPARLYLVGGTTIVYEGLRLQTLDIDLAIEVAAGDHGELLAVLREARDTLDINIEEAAPSDFIPLPDGYAGRHQYVGRYGQVDVFHFDLYSMALSKIERGRRQDQLDVLALLESNRLSWDRLQAMYSEILPLMEQKSLKQDSKDFTLNFSAIQALWRQAGGLS
jgi:hypothetical protein